MSAAFLSAPLLPHHRRTQHSHRHKLPKCATVAPPPANYKQLLEEAIASTRHAMSCGQSLVEIQFPPVPNMATAALNELLDANRAFAREFIRPFTPTRAPDSINIVFGDAGEARLARRVYGDQTPFRIRCMPPEKPPYARDDALVVVVQPGFNVSEWIQMENLQDCACLICINGDLDKVRGSYYPRLFYPGLYRVKTRFLVRFEPAYYIKQFSNGGTLMKRFDEPWSLFYKAVDAPDLAVLWSGEMRPDFVMIERLLAEQRVKDRLAS